MDPQAWQSSAAVSAAIIIARFILYFPQFFLGSLV